MSENITFSVSGSETYYHKDWLKSKGFKWVPSGKKWEKVNILELEADQLSEYCREFGLYYERSDKGMPKFDYESYDSKSQNQILIMRAIYGMEIFQIKIFGMKKRVFQTQKSKD